MFEIDADIAKARSLSSRFYTDESVFRESLEKIFGKSWHYICADEELSNVKPFEILQTPLVLARNGEEINCFSNVCTHRGAILVEDNCRVSGLRCRYHGRRFDLCGKFLSMPEFEGVTDFPAKDDDLPHIAAAKWQKFIFASLGDEIPLEEFTKEMSVRVQIAENYKLTATRDYQVNAHWALYCENYLEGFHVPYVHTALNGEIDYGTYTTEVFQYSNLQTAFDNDGNLAALYFFIFPNIMFNFYDWGLSLNIVRPVSIDKTTISYFTFVSDETKYGKGAGRRS